MLEKNIQELTLHKVGKEHVWCSGCWVEEMFASKRLQENAVIPNSPLTPFQGPPIVGVAQVGATSPFHNPTLYMTFMNVQRS